MKKTILIVDEKISTKSLILALIAQGLETITSTIFVGEEKKFNIDPIQMLIINRIEIDNFYLPITSSFSSRKWLHEKRGAKKLSIVSRKNYSRRNDRRSREYRTKACSD